MRQRWAVWLMGLLVLGMVAYGAWTWSVRRSVERCVNVFTSAMIQGDAETLLEQMAGPALENYLAKSPREQAEFTAPIPGATCQVRDVRVGRSIAQVRVLWKVSGFDIWSDFDLEKSGTGYWKITKIRDPQMVPTWEQIRKHLREKSAETPVGEALGEKLEGREGVEVHPLTDAERNR